MDLPSHRRRMRFVRNDGLPKAMTVGVSPTPPADELPEAPPPRPARRVRDLIPEDTREAAFALGKRTKSRRRKRARRDSGHVLPGQVRRRERRAAERSAQ